MTTTNGAQFDLTPFETHAMYLDAIRVADPMAQPCFEIMSGALIWTDERSADIPIELIGPLRQLWHFRTRCILQNEIIENEIVAQCRILFPNWIGFLPNRWIQNPAALAEYRRGNVSLRWCLRTLEAEMEQEVTKD